MKGSPRLRQLPASATLQVAFAFSSISSASIPVATSSSRLREGRPPGKQQRLCQQVVTLRKQNLSVHDIARSLARDGESLSPAAVAAILKEEGFAKLPRRRDEERPDQPRPITADVADVRQLDLAPRTLHTKFGGLFLFLPDLVAADLDRVLARAASPDRP